MIIFICPITFELLEMGGLCMKIIYELKLKVCTINQS